jgi:ABC-2 type transport system ATP-binding protein
LPDPVISIRGLRKSYGDFEAVRGIDLEVQAGEVFAFLGPNGAGKTTTVEILEGYRKRSGGEVSVLGEDPQRGGRAWRERIGIVLQSCRLDPYLTVRESLGLYAGYYRAPRPVDEVIELVGLAGKADDRARSLSGGQQRRLDVGMALVGDPELLFLDEPTTGFDPAARRQAWETIAGLRDLGKTVFLTTHYMDEAQRLADRVMVISGGEIVAAGTPEDLGDRGSLPTTISYQLDGEEISVNTTTPVADLHQLTERALQQGLELEGLEVTRPSLEDVYLSLTAEAGEGDQ